jgi:hypothetical protein
MPAVTDEDIVGACGLLGLSAGAFHGDDGADPRCEVLKDNGALDVSACPGSGKTTLLVAKLAILAGKWSHRTRGMCVLSHTNTARREIESRLGGTDVGRALLAYPHFVGTTHKFVGEFLAVPWLRSRGYPIRVIDTETCQNRRWVSLPRNTRTALEKAKHGSDSVRVVSADFKLAPLMWAGGTLGAGTPTYRALQEACKKSTEEGYLCYDDLFVWARDLLKTCPGVVAAVRHRFPVLFVDEAQDNSEEQSACLYEIFTAGGSGVIRQRFGDGNQAIFSFVGERAATTDPFPGPVVRDLPSSHRFGQGIASLSDPLGLIPHGLQGRGPKQALASGAPSGRHTVFVFSPDTAHSVLDAYGALLSNTFSASELASGVFTAVGQVHTPPGGADPSKVPQCIRDYWPAYDPELARSDPQPSTFLGYLAAGLTSSRASGEAHSAVELIAQGVVRLCTFAENPSLPRVHARHHRHLQGLLQDNPPVRQLYEDILLGLCIYQEPPDRHTWERLWIPAIKKVAEAVADVTLDTQQALEFLRWSADSDGESNQSAAARKADNYYRYPADDPVLAIRVGSVHAAKGQTHAATLVLETFWNKHNIRELLPWLTGISAGGGAENDPQQKTRLKVHYVAMTRPAHLLCIALRRDALEPSGQGTLFDPMSTLSERGWNIETV